MKDIDRVVSHLARAQFGVFSRRQAVGGGGSASACDRRLASGAWVRTRHPLVYALPGSPPSWKKRLMSAVLAGPAGTVASHRSAAVLHGLREGTFIELTVPPASQHRIRARVHQIGVGAESMTVDGIPVTRVERTLLDLAAVAGDDEVELALEAALRKRLTTVARVEEQLQSKRSGVRRLRRVLERRSEGRPTGSDLEVLFLQLLRAAGLPDPVRQHEVPVGEERYFLDLSYPERRLLIELDGRETHEGPVVFQRDRTRQNALVLLGWTVLRFTWADVTERPDAVLAVMSQVVAA